MFKILIGFVLGLAVATVGFGGLATLADNGVKSAKATLQEHAGSSAPKLSPELQAAIAKELAENQSKK